MAKATINLIQPPYTSSIPETLRALADAIDSGEYPRLESVVLVSTDSDNGVNVFSSGRGANDLLRCMGILDVGKDELLQTLSDKRDS